MKQWLVCIVKRSPCVFNNRRGWSSCHTQRAESEEQETETRRCADSDTASRSSFQNLFVRWWSKAREEPAMQHAEVRRNGRVQGGTSFKMVPFFLWQRSKIKLLILMELIVFRTLAVSWEEEAVGSGNVWEGCC